MELAGARPAGGGPVGSQGTDGSLFRAVAADGAVRIVGVEVAGAAEITRRRHGLGPGAARIGADAVVAAALMSAHIKGEERLTLQIQGEDPRLAVFVEFDAGGQVRARVTPPDARPREGGRITGVLVAVKADARREMYRGLTAIEDGDLEAALGEHLGASAQVDAVLKIRSEVVDGRVVAARGALIEKLPDDRPGAGLRALAVLEVLRDRRAEEILAALDARELEGEPIEVLEWRAVRWRCRCSEAKVEDMLRGLGAEEIQEMIAQDGGAEIQCHFCNRTYRYDAEALRGLIDPEGLSPP